MPTRKKMNDRRFIFAPNDAHQWRAGNDAGDETDAQSARPLNALCSALSGATPLETEEQERQAVRRQAQCR
jgi:hypothetical protein